VLYRITHRTEYRYDEPVSANYSEAHLLPRPLPHQSILESALDVTPRPTDVAEHLDFFGNRMSYFAVDEPHTVLAVTARSVVDVRRHDALALGGGPAWDATPATPARLAPLDVEAIEARSFTLSSPLVVSSPDLRAFAEASFPEGAPLVDCARALSQRIHDEFEYKPGSTTIATGLKEVLAQRHGVCQDFAHLLVGCLRSMGLASRYVSGYLETEPPPGEEKLAGADASHAWAAVFVPGGGWLDLDPTNATVPDERYITTAWGRDYADVTPLKGVVYSSGGDQVLHVAVDVVRLAASWDDGAGDTGPPGGTAPH